MIQWYHQHFSTCPPPHAHIQIHKHTPLAHAPSQPHRLNERKWWTSSEADTKQHTKSSFLYINFLYFSNPLLLNIHSLCTIKLTTNTFRPNEIDWVCLGWCFFFLVRYLLLPYNFFMYSVSFTYFSFVFLFLLPRAPYILCLLFIPVCSFVYWTG